MKSRSMFLLFAMTEIAHAQYEEPPSTRPEELCHTVKGLYHDAECCSTSVVTPKSLVLEEENVRLLQYMKADKVDKYYAFYKNPLEYGFSYGKVLATVPSKNYTKMYSTEIFAYEGGMMGEAFTPCFKAEAWEYDGVSYDDSTDTELLFMREEKIDGEKMYEGELKYQFLGKCDAKGYGKTFKDEGATLTPIGKTYLVDTDTCPPSVPSDTLECYIKSYMFIMNKEDVVREMGTAGAAFLATVTASLDSMNFSSEYCKTVEDYFSALQAYGFEVKVDGPSGLKWKSVGTARPTLGTELTNLKLSDALMAKEQFTQEEWDSFGIDSLTADHFIRVSGKYCKPDDGASGLKWKKVGTAKPTNGTELRNSKLSDALKAKEQFTQEEWDSFGIDSLTADHFILVSGWYCKPDDGAATMKILLPAWSDVLDGQEPPYVSVPVADATAGYSLCSATAERALANLEAALKSNVVEAALKSNVVKKKQQKK